MARCEYRTWCEFGIKECHNKEKGIRNECEHYETNRFIDYLKFGRKINIAVGIK